MDFDGDSEFIDSLDYLSPPVKRLSSSGEFRARSDKNLNIFQEKLIKGNYFPNKTQINRTIKILNEPSTLVLQEIPRKKGHTSILRQTAINLTNPHQLHLKKLKAINTDIPLIKVTVIPKPEPVKSTKILRKRRYSPKSVQSSLSSQENSVQSKHGYLVVPGRRKDKLYEIQTTESATDSSEQVVNYVSKKEELVHLLHLKHLMQSMNMDKKKKKIKVTLKTDYYLTNVDENSEQADNKRGVESVQSSKHVEIFEISDDDRLVGEADAAQLKPELLPDILSPRIASREYDSYDDIFNKEAKRTIRSISDSKKLSIEEKTRENKSIHQETQCICDNNSCSQNSERPLIIITVYPQQDSCDISKSFNIYSSKDDKITQAAKNNATIGPKRSTTSKKRSSDKSPVKKPINRNQLTDNKQVASSRSRSPSPSRKSTKKVKTQHGKETKTVETQMDRNVKKSDSPNDFTKLNRGALENNKRQYTRNTINDAKVSNPPQGLRSRASSPQRMNKNRISARDNDRILKPQSPNINKKPEINKNQELESTSRTAALKSKSPRNSILSGNQKLSPKLRNTAINTEQTQIKKPLGDRNKRADKEINTEETQVPPKLKNSKIIIQVNTNREQYNLQLNQDQNITSLFVRKSMKEMNTRGTDENNHVNTGSMENFVPFTPPSEPSSVHSGVVPPLKQETSMMTIKDSLVITHRKAEKNSAQFRKSDLVNNKKKSATSNVADKSTDPIQDDSAPVKHFTGDDCDLSDPIARDKQIRELLGVNKTNTSTSTADKDCTKNVAQQPYPCFEGYECLSKGFSDAFRQTDIEVATCRQNRNPTHTNFYDPFPFDDIPDKFETEIYSSASICQQLLLNQNLKIFLQVEQLPKHKPIVLTRKQYKKIKSTIQTTLSYKKEKRKCIKKTKVQEYCSDIDIGEVRKIKIPETKLHFDKEVQTSISLCDPYSRRMQQYGTIVEYQNNNSNRYSKNTRKIQSHEICKRSRIHSDLNDINKRDIYDRRTAMLYSKEYLLKDTSETFIPTRTTVSSVEVRYTTVAYKPNISQDYITPQMSSSKVSLRTIFKGRRKSPTPNLGTSGYSFISGDGLPTPKVKIVQEEKPKKQFFRRIIACLRTKTKTSEFKCPFNSTPETPNINYCSTDSYHINTSLGAFEISSSMYDTSESFYSNHTISPVSKTIKRGFFSSVREFLTSRRVDVI